ncbi:MAG: PhzF family phenazine biosynthesis protein [Parvibaculum sp.]|nr:PhzF family phenazine biosynthesis protein [Parvibaculum sp.]
MKARLYQVDAFASRVFEGNPAAVVPMESWPGDDVMQAIAAENNLAETAFFVPEGEAYRLRWFTPTVEVPLCGHATLASAHVLFTHLKHAAPEINFETQSGRLTVKRDGDRLAMDFPADQIKPYMMHESLPAALGSKPILVMKGKFLVTLFGSAAEVARLNPDMVVLKRFCESQGSISVICMAAGDEGSGIDFVSRMFAPAHGIDEDPVTGSAHCSSVPYWAKKLGKSDLVARQISKRGGTLWCTDAGERVIMRGTCVDYLQGEIEV